jgi:signal transduction histidine kinase
MLKSFNQSKAALPMALNKQTQQIELHSWISQYFLLPLSAMAVVIFTMSTVYLWQTWQTGRQYQLRTVNQAISLLSVAIPQSNRALIEAGLDSIRWTLNSPAATLCLNNQIILQSGYTLDGCAKNRQTGFVKIMQPIPGFDGYSLATIVSIIPNESSFWYVLIISTFLLIFCAWLALRIKRQIVKDVFLPLSVGLNEHETLRIKELDTLQKTQVNAGKLALEAAVGNAMIQLTAQVAHDIRSPISALNMVTGSLKELPEDKRLIIRNASQRINDIANGLLKQSRQVDLNSLRSTNSTNLILYPNNHGSPSPTNNLGKNIGAFFNADTGPVSPAATTTTGQSGNKTKHNDPILLVAILDSIISEKRMQFRERMEIEIQGDLNQGYGLFAMIDASELARVISNLVNNSVEAFTGPGRIMVAVRGDKDFASITISDNGKGIPSHILAKLGERGVTHGKDGTQSGSGLGVYYAREVTEMAKGKFSIQSQVGLGTVISMTLPRAGTPDWFLEKLELAPNSYFISADDDQTIHQIWSGRLASAGASSSKITHLTFASMAQLEQWIASNINQANGDPNKPQTSLDTHTTFLIDYEFLGQAGNGLDVIEQTGIAKHATLVTSRYEEPLVRARAKALGVRILPKGLAPFIPLHIAKPRDRYGAIVEADDALINRPIVTNSNPLTIAAENAKTRYDLCLIDDDTDLIHPVWATVASSKGLNIKMFSTPQAFLSAADKIDRQTPVYIDVSLGNGVSGIDVAHDIHKLGFTEINLATGYQADSIVVPPFIHHVVGKDFPEVG